MSEKRAFECTEIRAEESEDGKKSIKGYAAVFERDSVPMGFDGKIRERVAKGAFVDSLKDGDVRALWSHNPDFVLGRTKSGTLKLKEDQKGLAFELDLPDTQVARDAFTLIKRGDVTGMSFGFNIKDFEWERGEGEKPHIRTLTKVDLHEISPVAFPAYPDTEVVTRSLKKSLEEQEKIWEAEQEKPDAERQKKVSKALAAAKVQKARARVA